MLNHLLLNIDSKLTSGWIFNNNLIIYYFSYSLVTFVLCALMILLVVKKLFHTHDHVREVVAVFLLYWAISTAVPILGLLFSLLCILLTKFHKLRHDKEYVSTAEVPQFRYERFEFGRSYGEGGAFAVASDSLANKEGRLRAIVNLNQMGAKGASKVNKLLSKEKTDDIRLYSYIFSEKKRQAITKHIASLENLLSQLNNKVHIGRVSKWLAELHWEYMYFGLLDPVTEGHMKKKFHEYTKAAFEIKQYASLHRLIALMHFFNSEFKESKASFEKALELGYRKPGVMPYLLEIALKEKDYALFRSYLSQSNANIANDLVDKSKKFWQTNYEA